MDFTNRKRLRLEDYNYSGQGTYFLTLCSIDKTCLFSRPLRTLQFQVLSER